MPTHTRSASPARPTLATAFDPRRNGLTVLRLALAATVAVAHALQLSQGWQPVVGAGTELGALAVDGFFVLSGFLVTASLLRLGSVRRYLWHRFLRIMPAFWMCLLVTAFVIAPAIVLLRGAPVGALFTGEDSAPSYVRDNALLLMRQFVIAGLPAGTAGHGVVNGALWTLFYEAVCYLVVVALGVAGLLTRRRWLVLALVVVLQAATIAQSLGVVVVPQERLLRLTLLFLLGALGWLYADRIATSATFVLLAAALLVAGVVLLPDYRAVGAAGLAYLLLVLGARSPVTVEPRWDLSYGLYVYHWPVALLLLAAGAGTLPAPLVVAAVLVAALLVATASWLLVEAPALRAKSAAWVTAAPRSRAERQRRPVHQGR